MDWKIEVIMVPVEDPDRSKHFYADQLGFHVDVDDTPAPGVRIIQMTPPGSGCSVTIGMGLTESKPGSLQGVQICVGDIEAAHAQLVDRGVEVSDVQDFPWGRFVFFHDPDGNAWAVQQIPPRPAAA